MATNNTAVLAVGGMVLAAVVAGGVGLMFTGAQQTEREQSSNVGNLPATNANVSANAQAILRLENVLRAEINRRENETIKYVDTLDVKKQERVDGLEKRVESIERMIFDHVNTPKASHGVR